MFDRPAWLGHPFKSRHSLPAYSPHSHPGKATWGLALESRRMSAIKRRLPKPVPLQTVGRLSMSSENVNIQPHSRS